MPDLADATAHLDLVVLGSVMVELTPLGEGQPIRAAEQLVPLPSGAATNFAVAAQRLGLRVGMISRVGSDEWGEWLRARLAALGLDVSHVQPVRGQYSPVSFCWMDRHGTKTFYFYRFAGFCDPLATLTAAQLPVELFGRVRCFDFTEASVRQPPLREAAFTAAQLARGAGCLVVYAVNYRPAAWQGREGELVSVQQRAWGLADVVVLNREEAALLCGLSDPAAAAGHIAELGPKIVALTAGAEGSWLWYQGAVEHVPAYRVPVRYDIGAGDVFHAGLVTGLLRGLSPLQAARFASAAAALKISRPCDLRWLPTWEETCAFAAQAGRPVN
jgi:sugar/nucleoside kinase (ribokinase family)